MSGPMRMPPNGIPPKPSLDRIVQDAAQQQRLAQAMAAQRQMQQEAATSSQILSLSATKTDEHGNLVGTEKVFLVRLHAADSTKDDPAMLTQFYVQSLAIHVSGALLFLYAKPFVKGAAKIEGLPVPVTFATRLHFSAANASEWEGLETVEVEPWMRTDEERKDLVLNVLHAELHPVGVPPEDRSEWRVADWQEFIDARRNVLQPPSSTTSAEAGSAVEPAA